MLAMNKAIVYYNQHSSTRKIKLFTEGEFLIALGLLIGSVCYAQKGSALWNDGRSFKNWETIEPAADFDKYMKAYRFKEFRRFLPVIYENPLTQHIDPWWKFSEAIKEFNKARKDIFNTSNVFGLDETMSAFKPQKTKTGGLPNITYILRKPEPLGTEFKNGCCSKTGVMTFMELQRGKNGMKEAQYNRELGATAGCTVRLSE